MTNEKYLQNYVKNLSKYNEWFEGIKHDEDEDFDIKHTIDTHGKIGIEEIKYSKED